MPYRQTSPQADGWQPEEHYTGPRSRLISDYRPPTRRRIMLELLVILTPLAAFWATVAFWLWCLFTH